MPLDNPADNFQDATRRAAAAGASSELPLPASRVAAAAPAKAKPKQKPKLASFMAQWFRQYHKSVTLVAAAALGAILYLVVLGPKLSAARVVAGREFDRVAETRARLASELSYLEKLASASRGAPQEAIRDIEEFLPSKPETPQILTSLEAIAASSGVLIDGIEFVIPEEDEAVTLSAELGLPSGVSFVEATLAIATSPYDSLKTLLANIEQNLRLMDVVAVVYSPAGKSYTITLRAYYLIAP